MDLFTEPGPGRRRVLQGNSESCEQDNFAAERWLLFSPASLPSLLSTPLTGGQKRKPPPLPFQNCC